MLSLGNKEKTMKIREEKTDLDDLILVLHRLLLRSQLLADICILHTHAHQVNNTTIPRSLRGPVYPSFHFQYIGQKLSVIQGVCQ